jgi:N-acyl-D-amino-acid deacylase
MGKKEILFALLALLLAGCQRTSTLPTTGEVTPGMDSYDRAFARIMKKWAIPGGALAVIADGRILLARGYGLADVERNDPVQPESLFRIASLSKPVTAVAILKLVEEGRLSLDTEVFRLLDDLEPPAGAAVDPRIYSITIRHLLEHSGGWDANQGFDPMFASQEIAEAMGAPEPVDSKTVIRFMLGQPLDYDPGSRYAYANFGYCVLGRVIERVTGQPCKSSPPQAEGLSPRMAKGVTQNSLS